MSKPNVRARTAAVIALVVLTALSLAGCGSSSSAQKDIGVDAGGLKGDPIKVGTICSCTGPLAASLSQSLNVLKAWASWTNTNGGINGHPVKVVTYDDGQNPATGLSVAKKLVEQDKVMAIVGTMSLVSNSWASYVDGKGIPVVGGQPVDTTFMTDPNFFASGTTLPLLLLAEVTLAKQSGAKKIGVYYCSETPVCAQLPAIIEPLAKQIGLAFTSAKVAQSAPSYVAPCLAFKKQGVDAVFAGVNSDVVPRLADACASQGYKPLQVASSATTQKSWTTDKALDGSVFAGTNAVYTDQSVAGVKDFTEALKKFAPKILTSPQFSYPLIYPWAGGQLFAAAAKAGKLTPTSTGADVVAGLRALKDETLDGIAPPLTFPEGRPGFPLCYFSGKISGGEFSSDNGGKATCIDAQTAQTLQAALAAGH